VCLYSCLSYPARKSHLFYAVLLHCHLACPALPYFSTLSHKRQDFSAKTEDKLPFYSTNRVYNIYRFKNNSTRHTCSSVFTQSTRYSCQILMKPEFSLQVFEKYLNIKYHENPSSGSRAVHCGPTGTTKLIVTFGD
jgi:hypothetical protein